MARAAKVCSEPGCSNVQPCELHETPAWAGSTRRKELPPDWEHRRKRVLRRDTLCQDGRACNGLALSAEVHHTGDRDDHRIEGLQGVCAACHRAITLEQAQTARRM